MTNKALAAVIELTGELPAEGETFQATEEGNQYEFTGATTIDSKDFLQRAKKNYKITKIKITENTRECRVLQNGASTFVCLIDEWFIQALSAKELVEDIEERPVGPVSVDDKRFMWHNDICSLIVGAISVETEITDLIGKLEETVLDGIIII
ncbi:hypothetical protein LJC51_07435 [Lachnospiraceae bacterium OttesenSCG-928-J05]|nr:hypothetical protein [Lachnospiraceae bacterium OttesenSCG-928-J05]